MPKTKRKKSREKKLQAREKRAANAKYALLEFESNTYIIREGDGKLYSDHGEEGTDWTLPGYFDVTNEFSYRAEPLLFEPVPGQDYFMVYAIWSTGDSFSHHRRANCEAFGIYETFEKAEHRVKELSKNKRSENDISIPWHGYFESLDELGIKTVTFRPGTKGKDRWIMTP